MKILAILLLIANLNASNDLRIYESGMAFLLNQNYSEAMKEFQTLVEQYPGSEKADDALLEMGKYNYKIGDMEKALTYFNKIINNYKKSDTYDNALFYKAMILLDKQKIDDAYELLYRIKTGIPDSDVLDRVYYHLGEISGLKGNYKQGLFFLSRIYMRFPESDVFKDSMQLASYFYAKINNPQEGLKMLAIVNEEGFNDYKNDLYTINLLRFYLKKKYLTHRVYYQMPKPWIMATDKMGTLYSYSRKDGYIYEIKKGRMRKFSTPSDVTSMCYSEKYGFFYSTSNRVFARKSRTSRSFTDQGEPLKYLVSIAIDYFGNYWIYDKDRAVVYCFDKNGKLIKKIITPADYIKVRRDGSIFIVRDSRSILDVRNKEGKSIKMLTSYKKIIDMDFDNFDNIYLLCDKGKTLVILNHDFTLFQKIDIYNMLGGKYYHIAVDGDGSIFLSNKSSEIVRFD